MGVERSTAALHVIEKGATAGPRVVLIHGLLGSARNLRRLTEAVGQAGFGAIAYDQRGHGHSPHAGDYSLDAMADDLVEILDARGIGCAHLVGHSFGARVALTFTGLHPRRVLSLTMLDAGPRLDAQALSALREIIDPLPMSFASKAQAESGLSGYTPQMRQFLMSSLRDREGRLAWTFDLAGIRTILATTLTVDQTSTWLRVRCATLVVRGESSTHLSAPELETMRSENPSARVAVVARAGHWLHVDNHDETARAVLGFLDEQKGRS